MTLATITVMTMATLIAYGDEDKINDHEKRMTMHVDNGDLIKMVMSIMKATLATV